MACSWPLPLTAVGALGNVRPSAHDEAEFNCVHRLYTSLPLVALMKWPTEPLGPKAFATAWVQLVAPQKDEPVPPNAVSKNGCAVIVCLFAICCHSWAKAVWNCCPPEVIMYGTASKLTAWYSLRMTLPV